MGFHMFLCVHVHTYTQTRDFFFLTCSQKLQQLSSRFNSLKAILKEALALWDTHAHTHTRYFLFHSIEKQRQREGERQDQQLYGCVAVCCGRSQITIRAVGIQALSQLGRAQSQEQQMNQPWVRACRGTNTTASVTVCLTTRLAWHWGRPCLGQHQQTCCSPL